MDLTFGSVGGVGPSGECGVEDGEVVDASAEALFGEAGQFSFGDVEPGAMLKVWWISSLSARA